MLHPTMPAAARTTASETTFTPGPWEARGLNLFPKGDTALTVAVATRHRAESDANARLIAAVPLLFAACDAAKDLLIDKLHEPERTVFWRLVDALNAAVSKYAASAALSRVESGL